MAQIEQQTTNPVTQLLASDEPSIRQPGNPSKSSVRRRPGVHATLPQGFLGRSASTDRRAQ